MKIVSISPFKFNKIFNSLKVKHITSEFNIYAIVALHNLLYSFPHTNVYNLKIKFFNKKIIIAYDELPDLMKKTHVKYLTNCFIIIKDNEYNQNTKNNL